MQHGQESRTVSLFFYDLDLLSSSSSSSKPRSWNAAKYTREYEYSLKCFLIVNMLNEIVVNFFNYPRNLATPSGIADDVEDSEKRRN